MDPIDRKEPIDARTVVNRAVIGAIRKLGVSHAMGREIAAEVSTAIAEHLKTSVSSSVYFGEKRALFELIGDADMAELLDYYRANSQGLANIAAAHRGAPVYDAVLWDVLLPVVIDRLRGKELVQPEHTHLNRDGGDLHLTKYVQVSPGRFVLREALDVSHPESWPSRWRAFYGREIPDGWETEIEDVT